MADLTWKKLVDDAKFHWDGEIYRKDTYGEGTELYPDVYRIGTIGDNLGTGLIGSSIAMYKLTGQAVYLNQAKATADFLNDNMLHPTTNLVYNYTRSGGKDLSGATYSSTATNLSHIADLAKIDNSYNALVTKLADAIVNYHFSALNLAYRSLYPDGTVASNVAVLPNNQSGTSVGHISIALLKAYEVTGTESYKTAVYNMLVAWWNERTAVDLISDRINADTGEELEVFTRQYAVATYMSSLLFYYYLTKDTVIYNIIKDYSVAINTHIKYNVRWVYRTNVADGSVYADDEEMNDQFLNDVMFRAHDINSELGNYSQAKSDAKYMYYPTLNDVSDIGLIRHKGTVSNTQAYMRTQFFAVNYNMQRLGKDDSDDNYYSWLEEHYNKVMLYLKRYYGGGGYQNQIFAVTGLDYSDSDALCISSISQLVNFATYFMVQPSSGVKVVWDSIGDFSLESVCRHIGYAGYEMWFDKVHFDYENRKIILDDVTGSGSITFIEPIAYVKKDGVEYTNFIGKILTIAGGSSYVIYLKSGGGGEWKYDLDEEFNSGFHNDTEPIADKLKMKYSDPSWDWEEDCVDDADWTDESGAGCYVHDEAEGAPAGTFEFFNPIDNSPAQIKQLTLPTITDEYIWEIKTKCIVGGAGRDDQRLWFRLNNKNATYHALYVWIGSDGIYIYNKDNGWDKITVDVEDGVYVTWQFRVKITGADRLTATVDLYKNGVFVAQHTNGVGSALIQSFFRVALEQQLGITEGKWEVDWMRYHNGAISPPALPYPTTGDWSTPVNTSNTRGWISQINLRYKIKDANYNISKIKIIAKTTYTVPAEVDWDTPTDELVEGTDYTLTKDDTYQVCRIFYSRIWHTEAYEYFFFRIYLTGDGDDTPIMDWIEIIHGAIAEIPIIYNVSISDNTPYTYQKITITCSFSTAPDEAYVKIGEIEEDISDGSAEINCQNLDAGIHTLYIHSVKDGISDEHTATVTVTLGYEYEAYDPRKDIRETIGVYDATEDEYYIPVEDKNGDTQKVWMYLRPEEDQKQPDPVIFFTLVTPQSRMSDIGGEQRAHTALIDCNVYVPRSLDNIEEVDFMKKLSSVLNTLIRNNQNNIRNTRHMEMTNTGRDLSALEGVEVMRRLFEIYAIGKYY